MSITVHSEATGRDFLVRVVKQGDRYGRNNYLIHGDEGLMIEFYDKTYAGPRFGARGQFVSRFYLCTLEGHVGGLCLDGGNAAVWSLDAAAVAQAVAYAQSEVAQ